MKTDRRIKQVTGDWLPEGVSYPALLIDGNHWNGWMNPGFDRKTALRVVADQQALDGEEDDQLVAVEHDGKLTVFHLIGTAYRAGEPDPERWVSDIIKADTSNGGRYWIGCNNWCWYEAEHVGQEVRLLG